MLVFSSLKKKVNYVFCLHWFHFFMPQKPPVLLLNLTFYLKWIQFQLYITGQLSSYKSRRKLHLLVYFSCEYLNNVCVFNPRPCRPVSGADAVCDQQGALPAPALFQLLPLDGGQTLQTRFLSSSFDPFRSPWSSRRRFKQRIIRICARLCHV